MRLKTPHGPARAHLHEAEDPVGALILGHGAGGGISAPDLAGVTKAAVERSISVALITQPYRVAGRRSPAPAAQLDAAWIAAVSSLKARKLFVGGRSSGARVACRTAAALNATGVVALAFPLHAPGKPEKSRADELLS